METTVENNTETTEDLQKHVSYSDDESTTKEKHSKSENKEEKNVENKELIDKKTSHSTSLNKKDFSSKNNLNIKKNIDKNIIEKPEKPIITQKKGGTVEKVYTSSIQMKTKTYLMKEESKSNRNNKKINYNKLDKSESREEDFSKKKSTAIKEEKKIEINEEPIIFNLEDLMILENKLYSILEKLRINEQPVNNCFEFWNYYFFQGIGDKLDACFRDESSKKISKESNLLELLSVMLTYDCAYEQKNYASTVNNLKHLIYVVHQNFLIMADYILSKIVKNEKDEVNFNKMQNLILTKLTKRIKKGENLSILKQNSLSIIDSLKSIFRIYSSKKELIEILSSYIKNLQKINFNNLNELFQTKIYKVVVQKVGVKFQTKIFDSLYRRSRKTKPLINNRLEKKKYTLVLDLDETLIHFKIDDKDESKGVLRIRPGLFDFLDVVCQYYELVIFTAATQDYADPIIDALESEKKYFDYRLYRQHTIEVNDEITKDLSNIGRNIKQTIIVDNMPQNFKLQNQNGIFIKSFYGDNTEDTALTELSSILQKIAEANPVDLRNELDTYKDEILMKVTLNTQNLQNSEFDEGETFAKTETSVSNEVSVLKEIIEKKSESELAENLSDREEPGDHNLNENAVVVEVTENKIEEDEKEHVDDEDKNI